MNPHNKWLKRLAWEWINDPTCQEKTVLECGLRLDGVLQQEDWSYIKRLKEQEKSGVILEKGLKLLVDFNSHGDK
jgi:hypothetical protein